MIQSINPLATTENIGVRDAKIRNALRSYPELLRGLFDNYSGKTVKFNPEEKGSGVAYSRFTFEIGEESRSHAITDAWTLDLNDTGIDLPTKTGGLVDGIAFANGRDYLVWAFLDDDPTNHMQFSGLGVTRKPYSTFSAISSGNKGSTATITVATNCRHFTIGARVCLRNTNGTAPFYEWNWGTIASHIGTTQITVTMDNNSGYGTNITSATGGEVLQWDKFRPWVVSGSTQALYSNYYQLLGEITTSASTGDILTSYRADYGWRKNTIVISFPVGAHPVNGTIYSLARWVPLWSDLLEIFLNCRSSVGAFGFGWYAIDEVIIAYPVALANDFNYESQARSYPNVRFTWFANGNFSADSIRSDIHGFFVEGGMRR